MRPRKTIGQNKIKPKQKTPHKRREQGPAYRQYQARRRRQLVRLTATAAGFAAILYLANMAFSAVPWKELPEMIPRVELPKKQTAVDIEEVFKENQENGQLPGAYDMSDAAQAEVAANIPWQTWQEIKKSRLPFLDNPSILYPERFDVRMPKQGRSLIPLQPKTEDVSLKTKLAGLFSQYRQLNPHLYYYNPLRNEFVNLNGDVPVAAASVIKLPLLLVYLQSLDEGKLFLDSPLPYLEYHRASGSGSLQYQPAGEEIPANRVATEMIRISDNTSTNILISALGGVEAVNRQFSMLGMKDTRVRNALPDLTGTNTISAYEMATVLYNIQEGPLLSALSRYNGLGILEATKNNRLIPAQLPEGTRVAHKTGDIGSSLGDSGIVYMPDGSRYILSLQVERPYNDYGAKELIQKASQMIYEHNALQSQQQQMLTNR